MLENVPTPLRVVNHSNAREPEIVADGWHAASQRTLPLPPRRDARLGVQLFNGRVRAQPRLQSLRTRKSVDVGVPWVLRQLGLDVLE